MSFRFSILHSTYQLPHPHLFETEKLSSCRTTAAATSTLIIPIKRVTPKHTPQSFELQHVGLEHSRIILDHYVLVVVLVSSHRPVVRPRKNIHSVDDAKLVVHLRKHFILFTFVLILELIIIVRLVLFTFRLIIMTISFVLLLLLLLFSPLVVVMQDWYTHVILQPSDA